MDHIRTSNKMNVKHCTLCQGETEYYCHSCHKDLCQHCKATHVIDLDTKDHEVMIYREKFKYLLKHDTCVFYSNRIYNKYCESCEIPVCNSCTEHIPQGNPILTSGSIQHKVLDIRTVYQTKRQQHKEMIHNVRSETLYNNPFLLKKLKSDVNTDVETCHREISRVQSEMIKRGQGLKDLMNKVLLEEIIKENITWIQIYEDRYEQLAYRPVEFLRFIKNARLPQIQDTPHLTQHYRLSLTQEINMEDLIELLSELQITEGGKRKIQAGNELLLTLLPSPVLQKSTSVKGVRRCYHISCVTPDRVWVSDIDNNLILTDTTTGDKLHSVDDSLDYSLGLHTVNSECELIYIDKDRNINKLSSDMKTTTTFIEEPEYPWRPQCVYCSPSSGDLLIGMFRRDTSEVRRYNNTGELTQTISHDDTHHKLYGWPRYITENNNGHVVVSDFYRAVVVTDREGRHRFSYRGPPSGSGLRPEGICTDTLSHILVCDGITDTVQMINKDGDFLSYLLTTESPGIHHVGPRSLSYDVNTHTLYVGSRNNNTVSVYRHINRHLTITDNVEVCDDVSVRGSPPSRSIPGYSQEEFDLFSAKEKARKAAEEAEKVAARATAAATKAAEAVVKATEGTKERTEAEAAAKAAEEAAEKAAEEAAAAIAATNAAAKAETVEAADEAAKAAEGALEKAEKAAKAARKAKRRAEVATISILNDDLYDSDYDDDDDDDDDDIDLYDDQYVNFLG